MFTPCVVIWPSMAWSRLGGPPHLKWLADTIADEDMALPDHVRELGRLYLEQIDDLTARVAEPDGKMKRAAKEAILGRRARYIAIPYGESGVHPNQIS